jgi:hypothetical protein
MPENMPSTPAIVDQPFLHVEFHEGPVVGQAQGVRVEDVIQVAVDRLERYQVGPLACPENEHSIRHLREAIRFLELRRKARAQQGVLHTMKPHETVRTEDELDDFSATGA